MPYHVKTPSKVNVGDVYWKGDNSWTNDYASRKQFSSKSDADAIKATSETRVIKNTSGVVCSTYTYQLDVYKNSTVVTE